MPSVATPLPTPLSRPRAGRWIGGVCAGLAARFGVPARRVRAVVALLSALGGLGLVAYVAFWLILPAEGADGAPGPRGVVLIAKTCGALLVLGALAVAGGAATVFGFGWIVVALAAAVLVGSLVLWPRTGPGWALLPIGAAVLPSVALAAGGLRIDPSTEDRVVRPATLPAGAEGSGLGRLLVDLRDTPLGRHGTLRLRVEGGVRDSVVALPHDRCVHVEIHDRALPVAVRAGSVLLGAGSAQRTLAVYGRYDRRANAGGRAGPTLRVDFSSAGGGLVVRDFPDDVEPLARPGWPYDVGFRNRRQQAKLRDLAKGPCRR